MALEVPKLAGTEELERFLGAHPDTAHIDAVIVDLCGYVRGKKYPRADFHRLFAHGLQIPVTVYLLDAVGNNTDPGGRGFSDGDPDATTMPLAGTLVRVPWSGAPEAQVLLTMLAPDGGPSPVEPRNVARRAIRRFEELALRPVLAFELEFFLVDRERDARGRPQPPISPATGRRESATQVYSIEDLAGFGEFFRALESACEAQQIPASVVTSEFAPGQYEVNLRHVDDVLRAADQCALFRNAVKQVARGHGFGVTFMAKPYLHLTGSGMHVHMSLCDAGGRNVFADGSPHGAPRLRHAIGGLHAVHADAMAIFVPNANGFRRFQPDQYVPVNRTWSLNNRTTAVRIPAGPDDARRFEHRVSCADANPYLVLAVLLAGVHHGLTREIDPGPPSTGNACRHVDPDIPFTWTAALDRLERSTLVREYLGEEYVDLYCATKRNEMRDFNAEITEREYDWFL